MLELNAQETLEDMDDQAFCECLLALLENPLGDGLGLLWEEWVLARLRLIKQREARIFYGTFLLHLRRAFPGHVYPPDLVAAMQSVTTQVHVEGGDVTPQAWAAEIDEVFVHGLPQGAHPGWESLAPYYRPLLGDMTVITGIASHLKSSMMHALAVNLAKAHGWNFAAFNPEHHPLGSLGSWLIETYIGQPLHAMEANERTHGLSWVTDHFHMIRPPGEIPPTLPWLLAVARLQKQRYGLEGLILDPWNYIDHSYDRREESETQYVSKCLSMIRRFAEAQRMHVWIVAHPTKPIHGKATSGPYKDKYPPPTPYDISGGAHWYNKLDNCLCCWRDILDDSPVVEVHVQKVRRRKQCGRPGKIELRFDGNRFYDLADMTRSHWTERD